MTPTRPMSRTVGPATILGLVALLAVIWLAARPAGQETGSYVGQLIGAEVVLLWSLALVLISTLPFVEHWFDGIDRAAIWHRRIAIAGLLLVLPHRSMSSSDTASYAGLGNIAFLGLAGLIVWAVLPRWRAMTPPPLRELVDRVGRNEQVSAVMQRLGGYERWRMVHRITGVLVGLGIFHAAMDGSPYDDAPLLRWTVIVPGAIGLLFYGYRELLARRFGPLHDYQVETVTPLDGTLTEVVLRPLGPPIRFHAGQFALVYLEGKQGWQRHPFTMASAPSDPRLRLTIKGLGDYTSGLRESLQRGMPAVVGGPFGRFTHVKGTERQVWIAGGVGITPFLSWVRSFQDQPDGRQVDLFHTTAGRAPYADELLAAQDAHPQLRVHLIDSTQDGRLSAELILERCPDIDPRELSVFLCGPTPMLKGLIAQLRSAGVRTRNIHREHFDWR